MTRPFLLDCDTGIDDAMALLFLLSDPDADLVAVTNVFGNVSVDQTTENTLNLLAVAGRPDVPVFRGAEHPLLGAFAGGAGHVHGHNGIGEVQLREEHPAVQSQGAAEAIVRLSHEHDGRLNIVATAPLTNLAQALTLDPALPGRIASVTVMGGAASAPGNVTPTAEANIHNDPEAADRVLTAGWTVTLVPLDVTMSQTLEESDRRALAAAPGRPAQVVAAMVNAYFDFYEPIFGRRCSPLHDPLAAAIATGAVRPRTAPLVRTVVDTSDGPGRGQTIADLRGRFAGYPDQPGANTRIVLDVEQPFSPLLVERLTSLA